ncbi:hypothetical protein N8I77_006389 [Diaporthe amygdali]|uniref:Peptidase S8/S53 domain-containing protein n=1 Tax=Phomopsis amygdali TaxID=1214568 RepID=A0AAD9W3Y6_PHOAM|nr:hypothetical protein N8I77_006389 [Diaporthe amygdali]
MFEKRSPVPRAIFVNEPFLSSSFGGPGRLCCTEDDDFRSHPFPKILALGIMFLEIELGIRIEDYRLPVCIDLDGNPNVNADHIAAMEVFNKPDLWDKAETFGAFRTVIEVCLTPEPFIPFAGNSDDVRHILEDRVVHPLQKMYLTAWDDPETSTIRHIELDKSARTDQISMRQPSAAALHPQSLASATKHGNKRDTTPQPHGQLVAQWPQATTFGPEELRLTVPRLQAPKSSGNYRHTSSSSPYSISQDFPHDGTMSTKQAASSEIWFDELDRLTSLLRGKSGEKDESSAAAKIAILDTGVSEDAESPALKDYKDFTKIDDADDTWQDSTGHGTEAMRLILKVYSMAEIYVGRVFRSRQADADTASLMAKAIYHATNEWKVDIIIVPSGFKSHHQRIAEAIDHAIHARVLLFCAASNYGNLTEIAFPGRLYTHGKTLCMFSTDANVRCSPSFNPSPLSSARYSFAVLGENIALAPYNMHPDKTLSGTSYATMIGGALAGRILDFSRHKDTRDKIRHAEYLKTVEAPWKILPPEKDDDDETDTGLKRKDERKYVCETISRALEDIHST